MLSLGDAEVVNKLVKITERAKFLTHLDVSWADLNPKMLEQLSASYADVGARSPLRILNLSHNQLCTDEENEEFFKSSENFVTNIKKFIEESQNLTHLDFSQMNITREQSVVICIACSKSETLIGLHLSDNGIRYDQDWTEELVDCFGLDPEKIFPLYEHGSNFTFNMKTKNPDDLRHLVSDALMVLDEQAQFEVTNKENNSVVY